MKWNNLRSVLLPEYRCGRMDLPVAGFPSRHEQHLVPRTNANAPISYIGGTAHLVDRPMSCKCVGSGWSRGESGPSNEANTLAAIVAG